MSHKCTAKKKSSLESLQ